MDFFQRATSSNIFYQKGTNNPCYLEISIFFSQFSWVLDEIIYKVIMNLPWTRVINLHQFFIEWDKLWFGIFIMIEVQKKLLKLKKIVFSFEIIQLEGKISPIRSVGKFYSWKKFSCFLRAETVEPDGLGKLWKHL